MTSQIIYTLMISRNLVNKIDIPTLRFYGGSIKKQNKKNIQN